MDQITTHFKKGYKTTEFWLTLGAAVVAVVNATTGLDLDAESIIGLAGMVAAYVASRSFLKAKRVESLAYDDSGENVEITHPPVG